jgi:hypothetical protein
MFKDRVYTYSIHAWRNKDESPYVGTGKTALEAIENCIQQIPPLGG